MDKPTTGTIWRATIDVVRRHFGIFVSIAAAAAFLPTVLLRLFYPAMTAAPQMPALGQTAPAMPAGFFPVLMLLFAAQLLGAFTIAAITADPAEGGGRTLAATVQGALPAFGKAILAGLLFMLAYLGFGVVLGIVMVIVAMIAGIGMAAGGGAEALQGPGAANFVGVMVLVLFAVVVPLLTWLGARLSPLTGVYLREPVGVIDGIKRAWAMSQGSTWTIVRLVLVLLAMILVVVVMQVAIMGTGAARGGIVALIFGLLLTAFSAWLFMYQSAGLGIIYRQLRAAEAA